jgi:hypothetical protein
VIAHRTVAMTLLLVQAGFLANTFLAKVLRVEQGCG